MHSVSLKLFAAIALSGAVAACDSTPGTDRAARARADSIRTDSVARARQDSINRAQPGYVIDSVRPIEEEVRRFSTTIGGTPVTSLQHASASRDELVKRVVGDVIRGDTADLRAVLVTPREFIDLVYPSSPYTKPPYVQPPGLVWMQIANPSASGLTRLIRRRGGIRSDFAGYRCDPKPDRQGPNTLWLNCELHLVGEKRDTTTQRWFGTILERDGRFKLVSYKNQF